MHQLGRNEPDPWRFACGQFPQMSGLYFGIDDHIPRASLGSDFRVTESTYHMHLAR